MIVLGNKVVAGADFLMNENDFRNAADPSQVKYSARDYPEQAYQLAINATHLANVEMAGVDLLEDSNGIFYLLEVNFPTGFSGLINVCGVNIPRLMVMYLLDKSKRQ